MVNLSAADADHLQTVLMRAYGEQTGQHFQGRNPADEARCWCRPFVIPGPDLPGFAPLVLHRPDRAYVFWEHGEQGPGAIYQYGQPILTDPVFDDLDHPPAPPAHKERS